MEAIIISLLLFFSNTSFSVQDVNQNNAANHTNSINQTSPSSESDLVEYDDTNIVCSSGGKTVGVDVDGFWPASPIQNKDIRFISTINLLKRFQDFCIASGS